MKLEELLQEHTREDAGRAAVREHERREAQAVVRKVLDKWGITEEDGWQIRESQSTGLEDGLVIAHPQLSRVITAIRGPRFDTLAVPAHPGDQRGEATLVATAIDLVDIMQIAPFAAPAEPAVARQETEDPLVSIAASLRTMASWAEMSMPQTVTGKVEDPRLEVPE